MMTEAIASKEIFLDYLNTRNKGLYCLKLRALLELGQDCKLDSAYLSHLPPIGMGSITLVDQVALVLFVKLFKPKRCIEIGTFKGFTTRLLLDNTNNDCEVVTIDLPSTLTESMSATDETLARKNGEYNDEYLTVIQATEGQPHLNGITAAQLNRLRMVKSDSTTLDFLTEFESAEMVFIDGGHSLKIVKADTENAKKIVNKGVIVWHDFSSGLHTEVSDYINSLAHSNLVFHIENSLIAFQFINFTK
jgi:hypothetical protein